MWKRLTCPICLQRGVLECQRTRPAHWVQPEVRCSAQLPEWLLELNGGAATLCVGHTQFPKRTKITSAPCRIRTDNQVPRAEKFGDLITTDHKVLSEDCESRNNHRYAVVVQDLATRRLQSYPCKTKSFQQTERSLRKFLEPTAKPKVTCTDERSECDKACEELSWNHCTSTPHRFETNGIAERAVRRIKEGTSAVLLQSGLDEKWWAGSLECYCYLRSVHDLLADGETPNAVINI